MSDRTRSLIPVKTLHEINESKVDLLAILCGTSTSRSCSIVRCRKEFRLEDRMRSRDPVSNTVKRSANLRRRDIHNLVECLLLEAVMVYSLRHLDNLECRGTARRFAAECDPVECVSAQRGGQSCENCATDRRRQWCRQRRCILGVCVHILPSRPLELNRQKHSAQKKFRAAWHLKKSE